MFGKTPDPDFAEASLLEQYQAQIGSALTPAFAADSSPELASEAINVSATFIATGIVTNVERMGRILKVLVLGLENFSSKCAVGEFLQNAKLLQKTRTRRSSEISKVSIPTLKSWSRWLCLPLGRGYRSQASNRII